MGNFPLLYDMQHRYQTPLGHPITKHKRQLHNRDCRARNAHYVVHYKPTCDASR